jgi:anthranilate/para-aminobenzoate synthase component II
VTHGGTGLFRGLPSPLRATRYHSLIVSEAGLPAELEITARTAEGEIMALRHRLWPVAGVQFHPEALLTEGGHALLRNFLEGSM